MQNHMIMLQEASNTCKDPSVLRRLTFAAANLNKDIPNYWNIVTEFGFKKSSETGCRDKVKLLLENIQFLDESAIDSDHILLKELHEHEGINGHSLGVVLISARENCGMCGKHLLVREDRPSYPVVYSDDIGTLTGTHFRKYCSQQYKGCPFTQHYGYHQIGNDGEIQYDDNCLDLPYFLSSHMTAFQTKLLWSLSAEILLGQISYKQKSEIYNYTHGYDSITKAGPKTCLSSHEDDRYIAQMVMLCS